MTAVWILTHGNDIVGATQNEGVADKWKLADVVNKSTWLPISERTDESISRATAELSALNKKIADRKGETK